MYEYVDDTCACLLPSLDDTLEHLSLMLCDDTHDACVQQCDVDRCMCMCCEPCGDAWGGESITRREETEVGWERGHGTAHV